MPKGFHVFSLRVVETCETIVFFSLFIEILECWRAPVLFLCSLASSHRSQLGSGKLLLLIDLKTAPKEPSKKKKRTAIIGFFRQKNGLSLAEAHDQTIQSNGSWEQNAGKRSCFLYTGQYVDETTKLFDKKPTTGSSFFRSVNEIHSSHRPRDMKK